MGVPKVPERGGVMKRWAFIAICMIMIIPKLAIGGDSESERSSLKGLAILYVLVESLDAKEKELGFNAKDIRTAIEFKCRMAGINVINQNDRLKHFEEPVLYINVSAFSDNYGLCFYHINIELAQLVWLRSGQILHAVTWSEGNIVTVGLDNLSESYIDSVNRLADRFITAWLSVNPKR